MGGLCTSFLFGRTYFYGYLLFKAIITEGFVKDGNGPPSNIN